MVEGITFRQAQEADLDFVVEAILEADRSPGSRTSYCTLFEIEERDFPSILQSMLEEEIEGQELCLSGFLLATVEGEPAGGLSGWVEGEAGLPSGILKVNLLAHVLGRERIARAAERLRVASELEHRREKGAIQLESIYVREAFRNLLQRLFPVLGFRNFIPVRLQWVPQQHPVLLFIVRDQHQPPTRW